MEEIDESFHMKLLDFNTTKRRQWMKERKPYSVLFELTPKCNFNCIHCYMKNNHMDNFLSYEAIIKIIDILYDKGIIFLTFTGGEILTRNDFVNIYVYAKKKGFLVELFTNAFFITDDIIDVFKEYLPLLVDVSLYGDNDKTYFAITQVNGAFSKVINNCKKMVGAGIRVSLKSPILLPILNEIDGMKRIAKELGVPYVFSFDISPTIDKSNQPRDYQVDLATSLRYEFLNYFDQILSGERKRGENDTKAIKELTECDNVYDCNVAQNSFVIDYNGNILPCMKLRHRGIKLLDNNFDEIWSEFGNFCSLKASEEYKCKNCKFRYFCDVCPAEMEFMFGDAQIRPIEGCLPAIIRKKFYCGEITYEEAIKEAYSYEKYSLQRKSQAENEEL